MTKKEDNATLIGRDFVRARARRYVAGQGRYTDDITLPRTVYGAFLRSPHPHGRIASIDCGRALDLPGVVSVLTGRQMAEICQPFAGTHEVFAGLKAPLQHGMAVDYVRWQGEPFAVVAAETRAIAEDAVSLIEFEIDPLEGVGNSERALEGPAIHGGIGTNLSHDMTQAVGNIDAAFDAADVVVEETFRFARNTAIPLETRSILAHFEPRDGALTVYQSHQCPAQQQDIYARLLELPEHKVRVICPDVGGAFGIKQQLYGDELAICALSKALGRPVKFIADRVESFGSDVHAREHMVRARIALSKEGKILGLDVNDIFGIGAYSQYPRSSIGEGSHVLRLTGAAYELPAYRSRVRMVLQNKTPIGHYRAVGHPIATAVGEGLIDRAAAALGQDPLAIRRANYLPDDCYPIMSAGGCEFQQLSMHACLDRFEEVFDVAEFRREQAELRERGIYRGLGLATFVELTGTGPHYYGRGEARLTAQEGCHIRLEPSGLVRCFSSATDQGQGIDAAIGLVVAERLGVLPEAVEVISGDSSTSPYGGGAWASRGVSTGVEAAVRAADELREEILRVAGHVLQRKASELSLRGGQIYDRTSGLQLIELADIGRIGSFRQDLLPPGVQPNLAAVRHYAPERAFLAANGLQASMVEIDPGLGAVKLLRHVMVHDSGTVITPRLLDEQIRGGIAQGLGAALWEEIRYGESGELLTGSLADYLVPLANELPDIDVHHVAVPDRGTTIGAKGAGEAGTAGAAAAVLNAVNDALRPFGTWLSELPVTPQRVLMALSEADARGL